MRELSYFIPLIEGALGVERAARLRRDEDSYQQFWVGVLSALPRANPERELVPYLVSAGYGAVRNMRRGERTRGGFSRCPECGAVFGYRATRCPKCGSETVREIRHGEFEDVYSDGRYEEDLDGLIDLEAFVGGLSGITRYVARRWLLERADLLFANHLKQIASEFGVSAPRVAQVKKAIRAAYRAYLNG